MKERPKKLKLKKGRKYLVNKKMYQLKLWLVLYLKQLIDIVWFYSKTNWFYNKLDIRNSEMADDNRSKLFFLMNYFILMIR